MQLPMEGNCEAMDQSQELQCVGRLEVQKHKQVGFICGSLPVPTYDISNPGISGFLTSQDALIPSIASHSQRVRAPRYRMLPTETDLNTPPSDGILPEEVVPVTTPHKSGGDLHGLYNAWGSGLFNQPLTRKCETLAVSGLAAYGDEIDVVAPVDILKQIFKIPYTKARLSVAVHRIGRTLILNTGPDIEEGEKLVRRKKNQSKGVDQSLFLNFAMHSVRAEACDCPPSAQSAVPEDATNPTVLPGHSSTGLTEGDCLSSSINQQSHSSWQFFSDNDLDTGTEAFHVPSQGSSHGTGTGTGDSFPWGGRNGSRHKSRLDALKRARHVGENTTADPWKEPPLILVNTVLSVLAVDYPPEKMACYVSDDGGSAFNLFSLLRAYEFGNKWIPFCRKFRIEPRAPMPYFSRPIDKSMINNSHFTKEWEGLKEQYLKLKLDIATAMEARLVPKEAQEIFNELSGHQHIDVANHPGIIKVFQKENDFLPELIYVSREKRPGFKHHFKAGALNALARVSGVLTNSPFILNLDCDMYVNNSQALLQSMCFHLDPAIQAENRVSFVQFPQCFGDIDENDTFARKMSFAFDVVMKGLDGFQGPLCCGTGCVQRRDALYGSRPGSKYIKTDVKHKELHDKISETPYETLKKKFGKASEFIQLISCDYEASTEWGQEVGWMYGSSTEDIMTGFKLHTRGWRTIFYSPDRPAFVGTAPTVYSEILQQRKRWSTGMLEIFMSRNCPLFTGYGGLMPLQRAAYVNYCASSLYSIPLVIYGMLPTFSFITGKPFIPKVSDAKIIPFVIVFVSMHAIGYIEGAFIGINAKEWWNAARMWMTTTVSSVIVAVFEVFLKVFGLREAAFSVTPKKTDDGHDREGGVFMFDSSFIFVPPTTFVLFNIVGLVFGVVKFVVWGNLMLGELFCVCWILINLFHFVKGLFRGQSMGGLPKQTILKSASCACLLYYVAITLCH